LRKNEREHTNSEEEREREKQSRYYQYNSTMKNKGLITDIIKERMRFSKSKERTYSLLRYYIRHKSNNSTIARRVSYPNPFPSIEPEGFVHAGCFKSSNSHRRA